ETRIDLDREVAAFRAAEVKLPSEPFDQVRDLRGTQEVRRAPAQVQLDHLAIAVEQLRGLFGFAQQPFEVRTATAEIARNDAVAAAIEARAEAIRDVHIQRELTRNRIRV